MSVTKNLGRVTFVNRGAYDASVTYTRLDIVRYKGSDWCALQNVRGVIPTEGAYWTLIASKGDKGEKGQAGDNITVDSVSPSNKNITLNAVRTTPMSLSDAYKTQARSNINAQKVLTIDDALDDSSENIVENEAIKAGVDEAVTNIQGVAPAIEANIGSSSVVYATLSDAGDSSAALDLSLDIKLDQSLRGYSSPWPGGASKNLFDPDSCVSGYIPSDGGNPAGSITSSTTYDTSDFIPVVAGQTYTLRCYQQGSTTRYRRINYYTNDVWQSQYYETKAAAGEHKITVTIDTGINYVRLCVAKQDLNVQFEQGSSATSYVPYANICPISGRTGCSIYRSGKNLLSPHLYSGVEYNLNQYSYVTPTDNPVQFTESSPGVFTLTTSSNWEQYAMLLPVIPGQTYNIKYTLAATKLNTSKGFISKEGKVMTKSNSGTTTQNYNASVSAPDNAGWWYLSWTNSSGTTETITLTQPQAELGSTATSYEPYSLTTIPVDWTDDAGTVYGGSLDVTTGDLTDSYATLTLGSSTVFSESSSGQNRFYCDNVGSIRALSGVHGTCSHYLYVGTKGTTSELTDDFSLAINANLLTVYIKDSRFSTAAELNTYLTAQETAGTPVTIAYEKSTSSSHEIDPTTVLLQSGVMNLWADCGNITNLEYVADTKTYIDNQFAALTAIASTL